MRRFLSYLSRSKTRFLGEERPRKTTAPGRGNTMEVKDGEGAKKAAKKCLTKLLKPIENEEISELLVPRRWPKDMMLGRQGRHEGFKGSSGRRGGFKGSLLPNVAF